MDRVTDAEGMQDLPRAGGPSDRLLAWPRVREITGLSRTTAWRMQKAGDFPPPVQVSAGRVGWWQSDLDRWKASRVPRPLAEARPFRASVTPASVAAPAEPLAKQCGRLDSGPPATAPDINGKARRKGGSPDQFAFDFGS